MLAGVALRRLKAAGKIGGVPLAQFGVTLALICLMATLTVSHTDQWSGEVALYRNAIKAAPHSLLALNQLAMAEIRDNRDRQDRPEHTGAGAGRKLPTTIRPWSTPESCGVTSRTTTARCPCYCEHARFIPDKRDPHYYLGLVYLDKSQYAEAETELRQAIRLSPQRPEQHVFLGYALEKQGRMEEARNEYQAELQLNPNSTKARQAMAALPN